jgi:hypothetical protein
VPLGYTMFEASRYRSVVCDSRKNALLRVGNKNDREDARKLSELLFLNKLHPAYHGKTGICMLRNAALVDGGIRCEKLTGHMMYGFRN